MELKINQASGVSRDDSNGDVDGAPAASKAPISTPAMTPATNVAASDPVTAIPANAMRIAPADGVVRLPAGTRLDAIRVVGPDLVVTLPDGQVLVIVNGAVDPPQFMLGTINIAAANIASLIAGQEPEPAAGAPQSSGGNFEEAPGDIGDPFGIGDLLAATEFASGAVEDSETLAEAIDDEPEVLITAPDQPLGSASVAATVAEAALPARGGEPAGSDPTANGQSVNGTILIDARDQPAVVAVNGTVVTAVDQVIATPLGRVTITSIAPGAIGYSYTLLDNSIQPDASELVTVTLTDKDGDVATATLTLNIADDAPTARGDVEAIAPKTYTVQTGNVISGAGTASGAAGADIAGADGASVTGIRAGNSSLFVPPGVAINGLYGRLLINADGSYSYVRSAGTPGGVTDSFTYRLTDGDGDVSTATLSFEIGDSPVVLTVPGAGDEGSRVDEAGLSEREGGAPGSRAGDSSDFTLGAIRFDAADGPAAIRINGIVVSEEGQEIVLPTGSLYILAINPDSIEYGFILTDNVVGDPAAQPIEVTITDRDGDSVSSSFAIDIIDDRPTAFADGDWIESGSFAPATGNVLTDAERDGGGDIAGADGASVVRVTGADGIAQPAGGSVAGLYGVLEINADGSYRYTRNAGTPDGVNDVFGYSIADADGDESSATLTIFIIGDNDPVTISGIDPEGAEIGVAEGNLADGSAPDAGALTRTGSFGFGSPDGLSGLTVAGHTLFADGAVSAVSIETDHGIFDITAVSTVTDGSGAIVSGTIAYSYRLNGNLPIHSGSDDEALTETLEITVIDSDGSRASTGLDIRIADDAPVAVADSHAVGEGATLVVGAATGLLSNDVDGADGATIVGIRAAGGDILSAADGGVGVSIAGLYGELTVAADGSFTYRANPDAIAAAGATDIFVYTIEDGDGDLSTTTLTIELDDAKLVSAALTLQVAEAGLPGGSDPDSSAEVVTGDLNAQVSGVGPFSFALVGDGVGTNGRLVLNPDGSYSYTLLAPVAGTIANDGANLAPAIDSFSYKVTDAAGNSTQSSITIDLIDDVPVARAEPLVTVAEDAPTVFGDLLANDAAGADGAALSSVTIDGVTLTIPENGTISHVNARGTYRFDAIGSWSFDPAAATSASDVIADFSYTITDGDGDSAIAVQQIRVTDGADPRAGASISLALNDQNLAFGSAPSIFQPVTANGQIAFTPGTDPIVSIQFATDLSSLGGGLVWTRESDTEIIGWNTDIPVVALELSVSGNVATIVARLETNYALHGDATSADLAALGSVGVVAQDSDGDRAIGSVSVAVSDDVPTITARKADVGMLTVDESNLATNATANLGSLFDVRMGADIPGTVSYRFEAGTTSGLVDVATGATITMHVLGAVVEGRLAGTSTVAFRLSIAPDGQATLDQLRALRHADGSNGDDGVTLSPGQIRLFATATDADGDRFTAIANVGAALVFKDDGPTVDAASIDTNAITLTTQDADARGSAFDVASASFAAAFSVAGTAYGADGAPDGAVASWHYSLALGPDAAVSGLSSNGVAITLALAGDEVIGSAGGAQVFVIAVDAVTGLVTLTQFAELDHPLPGAAGGYAGQLLELPARLIELRGTATIADRDGDRASETAVIDLGGNIRFADDGPSIAAGGSAPVLVLDESFLATDASADLSGLFASSLDYGADGAGKITYALGVTAGPSGLIDALSGEAVFLSLVDGSVLGRTSSHEVFRISLAEGGIVTFNQSRAILHSPDSGPDQVKFLSGGNLITLTATATDGDGDTASATADITGHFAIRDDAPVAVHDEDNVARDGQVFADGNVLTGIGGIDVNGVDGVADRAGADGGLVVSAVRFGSTNGTIGDPLGGDFGTITIAADGSYRYELDASDPAVAALLAGQTLTDSFEYSVIDADGDSASATITITITGADDFPIARADTNWVLDGPAGSDQVASGNVLLDIRHLGAPADVFGDVADSDPAGQALSVVSAGSYAGAYGTLVIAADGTYSYTLNEEHPAVDALDSGQSLSEVFGYTISDGALSVPSTLTITVFGTNDAPSLGSAVVRISEEGLIGGNADGAPDAARDTTDGASFTGTIAIGDLDAGEVLTATLGDPGAVLTSGGLPVTWSGVGTATLVGSAGGSEAIRVSIAANGVYTVTLSRPVDHAETGIEDVKEFTIPVSVSDGSVATINPTAIRVAIEDDAPTATGDSGASTQPAQNVNTLFILDFSNSIDDGELDTMLRAVKAALMQLDTAASGEIGIKFVIFASSAFASPAFANAADAAVYLDSLNPIEGGVRPSQEAAPEGIGSYTNYTAAIQTALGNFSALPDASNQVFFVSDGNPNQGVQFSGFSVVNALQNATAAAWNSFVDGNGVNVTAIGIDNNPLQPLNIQRLADIDLNDAPGNQPILVDDFQDLVSTLLAVIVPSVVTGDVDANDGLGADGARIATITIGATTYSWNGADSISLSSGGSLSGSSLNAVETPMGAKLTFDFATGQYLYQPPTPITVTATEIFSYTLIDGDGDSASAALSIAITAVAPPVVLDLDGDGVEFLSGAAGVGFDYDGDGTAESTAWVGPDDGLLVLDKNGDGKIDNGGEIVFAHPGMTDLQGLAASYDSNDDGVLDLADPAFARFAVWQDSNSNGATDAGELKSLAQAGITALSLVSDARSYSAAGGEVWVHGEATYSKTDGSTGRLADAAFATNFAAGQQRATASAGNGVSTALLVAGMIVAAAPLAAETVPVDEFRGGGLPEKGPGNELREPVSAEDQTAGASVTIEIDDAAKHGEDVVTAQRQSASHDAQPAKHADWMHEADRAPADLPDDAGGVADKSRHADTAPFAAEGDQALAAMPSAGAVADPVKALVVAALEGRTVDLDSVAGIDPSTGPAAGHEAPLPALFGGFVADMPLIAGDIFMPDLAEAQIQAQLQQAAAMGHA